MDLTQLINDANIKGIIQEQELYIFLITSILDSSNLTLLLNSHEEIKQTVIEAREGLGKTISHQGKKSQILPSEKFYRILSQQKSLLSTQEDNEFVILLSSLKILESLLKKPLYKNVLKEIITNSLHKIKIPPLSYPFFGREKEIADIFRILDRSYKNSVIISGPSGIGKTTLVNAVLQKLRNDIIFQLFPGNSSIPDTIINLLHSVGGGKVLIFLDEIFSFNPEQIQNILDNKQVVVIATANDNTLKKFEKNYPEIVSKFEVINLEDPATAEVKQILSNRLNVLQQTYSITAEGDFLDEIYALSKQYLPNFSFPAKAISILEELVSLSRSHGVPNLKKEMIRHIISQKTKIPIEDLTDFDKKDLSSLSERLKARVKGQDKAIDHVVKVVQRSKLGFGKKNKPIGSFLFVGPSGVGKTELAKAVAQSVFGDEESMVRLDMSEFTEAHTIQRLIGAPPGYVGFEEGGQLTNPVKAKPYNLVLLDEIEKAHARVFDIFLQVLDDGRLTDGQGKMVDFRNTIIIATSNAGLDDILDLIHEGKSTKEIEKEVKEILQDYFRIEFINRFDGIIVFNSLMPHALEQIAYLQIDRLKTELAKREIDFSVSDMAIKQLAHMSYDPRYGARELLRLIQDTIENKLAEMILTGELGKNQKVVF